MKVVFLFLLYLPIYSEPVAKLHFGPNPRFSTPYIEAMFGDPGCHKDSVPSPPWSSKMHHFWGGIAYGHKDMSICDERDPGSPKTHRFWGGEPVPKSSNLFKKASFATGSSDLIDLQDFSQDFVLETKRIQIPGYPYAFNPSIIRWNGYILMSFRVIPDPKSSFTSWIGVLLLDEEFNPVGDPQFLNVRDRHSSVPSRAEDARLIYLGDQLYIVYSDNPNPKITAGGFRMVIGELHYENGSFTIRNASYLVEYEGEKETLREKNWVPFIYDGSLFLAYSIAPHKIFCPVPGTGGCETVATTTLPIHWNWGILRGGTQALRIDTGEYLAFFHSVIKMETANSMGKQMAHYFMGAYTFESKPPFRITSFSPEPIVGPGFYNGIAYKPYWGSIQCIFPAGMLIEGNVIWVSYGRQDHEIWVAKLDKRRLLESLVPIGF